VTSQEARYGFLAHTHGVCRVSCILFFFIAKGCSTFCIVNVSSSPVRRDFLPEGSSCPVETHSSANDRVQSKGHGHARKRMSVHTTFLPAALALMSASISASIYFYIYTQISTRKHRPGLGTGTGEELSRSQYAGNGMVVNRKARLALYCQKVLLAVFIVRRSPWPVQWASL